MDTLTALQPKSRLAWLYRPLARLRRVHLDALLAEGADPTLSPVLACRARALLALGHRRLLALGFRDVIERAGRPPRVTSAAPIAGPSVRANLSGLGELADRLDAKGTIGVRGVAAAGLLLTDGASPLWLRSAPSELHDAVEAALIGCGVVSRWT